MENVKKEIWQYVEDLPIVQIHNENDTLMVEVLYRLYANGDGEYRLCQYSGFKIPLDKYVSNDFDFDYEQSFVKQYLTDLTDEEAKACAVSFMHFNAIKPEKLSVFAKPDGIYITGETCNDGLLMDLLEVSGTEKYYSFREKYMTEYIKKNADTLFISALGQTARNPFSYLITTRIASLITKQSVKQILFCDKLSIVPMQDAFPLKNISSPENMAFMENCIKTHQPNVKPIPTCTIEHIKEYFEENLPQYKLCSIHRKSNHPEDSHLYMVIARKNDGSYAFWTSWNESTHSLNYGHYGLYNYADCEVALNEYFNDITDEIKKYGPCILKYDDFPTPKENKNIPDGCILYGIQYPTFFYEEDKGEVLRIYCNKVAFNKTLYNIEEAWENDKHLYVIMDNPEEDNNIVALVLDPNKSSEKGLNMISLSVLADMEYNFIPTHNHVEDAFLDIESKRHLEKLDSIYSEKL